MRLFFGNQEVTDVLCFVFPYDVDKLNSYFFLLKHPIPSLKLPAHNDLTYYPLPRVVFRMFDYADAPEVRVCFMIGYFRVFERYRGK